MYPGGRRGLVLGGSELTALKNSVCVCVYLLNDPVVLLPVTT